MLLPKRENLETEQDDLINKLKNTFRLKLHKKLKLSTDSVTGKTDFTQEELADHKSEQLRVLELLPDDLYDQLITRLDNHIKISELYLEHSGESLDIDSDKINRLIKGEFFEHLVRAEFQTRQEQEKPPKVLALQNQLLDIWQYPNLYPFGNKLKGIRNPDLAYIDIEGTTITIKAIGEAKLGRLDSRAFKQLTAFKRDLQRLIYTLINLKNEGELDNMGLDELIDNLDDLSINEPLEVYLFLPGDRPTLSADQDNETLHRNIKAIARVNSDDGLDAEELISLLLNENEYANRNNIEYYIERSSFSLEEISNMLEAVLDNKDIKDRIREITLLNE